MIQALKTTLRIPNQHIYTASLHTIASFLPVLMPPLEDDLSTPTAHEVILFRHALIAFLAPGGIIDRLGDAREKSREGAKEACVTAGLAAFKCSPHTHATSQVYSGRGGKGPETPLAMYERVLREQGFGSKSARVREQVSGSKPCQIEDRLISTNYRRSFLWLNSENATPTSLSVHSYTIW